MSTTHPRPVAIRFHDTGDIWDGRTRLARVLYQLRVGQEARSSSASPHESVDRPDVHGTLLPAGYDWDGVHGHHGQPLWLHLRDGRRLPVTVTHDAGSVLHIRALGDFEVTSPAA